MWKMFRKKLVESDEARHKRIIEEANIPDHFNPKEKYWTHNEVSDEYHAMTLLNQASTFSPQTPRRLIMDCTVRNMLRRLEMISNEVTQIALVLRELQDEKDRDSNYSSIGKL